MSCVIRDHFMYLFFNPTISILKKQTWMPVVAEGSGPSGQNKEGCCFTSSSRGTPSVICRGALEQGNKPPNALTEPCYELEAH